MDPHNRADSLAQLKEQLARMQAQLDEFQSQLQEMAKPPLPPHAPPVPKDIVPPADTPPKSLTQILDEEAQRPPCPPPLPEGCELSQDASADELSADDVLTDEFPDIEAQTRPTPSDAAPKRSFEQLLGMKWLNWAGVVLLVLAAGTFMQFAAQQGWVDNRIRVLAVALLGGGLIGIGEWARRRAMTVFAAGTTGGGVAMLYAAVFGASPNFYNLIPFPVAFGLMCVISVMAVALSLYSGLLSTALLAQVGTYLMPALLDNGQGTQTMLMTYLIFSAATFLAVSILRRWPLPSLLSLTGTVWLFGMWMAGNYEPASVGATLTFAWILAGLFWAASLWMDIKDSPSWAPVGVATGIVSGLLALLILVLVPARATPVLAVMINLIGVAAVTMAIAIWRQRNTLAVVIAWGGMVASLVWLVPAVDDIAYLPRMTLLWAMAGIIAGGGLLGFKLNRLSERTGSSAMMVVGNWLAILLTAQMLATGDWPVKTLWNVAAMAALALGVCYVNHWRGLRMAALVWVALVGAVVYQLAGIAIGLSGWSVISPEAWLIWNYALFALFSADVLCRAYLGNRKETDRLDTTLAGAAMALMYLLTRNVLGDIVSPMGLAIYTIALGIGAIVLALHLRWRTTRRLLSSGYLAQGLILLALSVPLIFDYSAVMLAWTAQAAVSAFLAWRTREKLLAIKAPVVLGVALAYLLLCDIPRLIGAPAVFTVAGGPFSELLLLTMAWSVGAGLVSLGLWLSRERWSVITTGWIWQFILLMGLIAWVSQTASQLPPHIAGWLGLLPLVALSVWLARSRELALAAGTLLCVGTCAFLTCFVDARALVANPASTTVAIIFNSRLALALLLAAAAYGLEWLFPRRLDPKDSLAGVRVAQLLGAVVILCAGSMEVWRYCGHLEGLGRLADPGQAMNVGLSLWWSVWAAALLVWGLYTRCALRRYLALGLFGITLGKVLLIDMANVETMYRILSLFALGALLVAASWLYHLFFRDMLKQLTVKEAPAEGDDE